MKPRHHFWSSVAVGGGLYWATGSAWALAGAMTGGFLIDSDHVIDQLYSVYRGAPYIRDGVAARAARDLDKGGLRAWLARYVWRRKLIRLPLVFHSIELLAALTILTILSRTPFLIGLIAGYWLHIALDLIKHHHEFRSPFFYLLSYRVARGFRRDRLIKPEYL